MSDVDVPGAYASGLHEWLGALRMNRRAVHGQGDSRAPLALLWRSSAAQPFLGLTRLTAHGVAIAHSVATRRIPSLDDIA